MDGTIPEWMAREMHWNHTLEDGKRDALEQYLRECQQRCNGTIPRTIAREMFKNKVLDYGKIDAFKQYLIG